MRKVKENKTKRGTAILFAVLRIIAAIICAFLLFTFIQTARLNQLNYGNIIGSIFCISVILLVILYPLLRKRRGLRIAAKAVACLQIVFMVYCGIISVLITSEIMNGEDRAIAVSNAGQTPQTVIVLGCQTVDNEPSAMLAIRLDRAIEYLKANSSAVCIVSGGQGDDENAPEAVTMRKYMLRYGIGEERIYIEPDSTDTTENIRYSAAIIDSEELPRDVVVVSECYHIYRGVRQARLAGLNASGIYPDPSPVIITLPTYWLREIFALSRDIFLA